MSSPFEGFACSETIIGDEFPFRGSWTITAQSRVPGLSVYFIIWQLLPCYNGGNAKDARAGDMASTGNITADRLWFIDKPAEWQRLADIGHEAAASHNSKPITLDKPVPKDMLCDALGSVVHDRYNYLGVSSQFFYRQSLDDPDLCVSFQWRFHQSKGELEIERMLASHVANQIVEEAESQFGGNQLAQLMYFVWWLITYVEYGPQISDDVDYDEFSRAQSAHGALLDRRAVCVGFSRALQMLCGRANIECFVVYGHLGNGKYRDHAWNMVEIDGQVAYIDLCLSKALSKDEEDGKSFPLLLDSPAMEQIGYKPSNRPFKQSALEGEIAKYRRVKMIETDRKVA